MACSRLFGGWNCCSYSKNGAVKGFECTVDRQTTFRRPVPGLQTATKLILQREEKSLPPLLVKQICEMKHLRELDLSDCPDLEVLPAAFAAHGVGRRLKVLLLPPQLDNALPDAAGAAAAAGKEWSPRKKVAAILLRQQRRQAILKLATQPEPMLTTLERLSWILIILATITLTVFLQPGMKGIAAGNAVELDPYECLDKAHQQFQQQLDSVMTQMGEEALNHTRSMLGWVGRPICRCIDAMLYAQDQTNNSTVTWPGYEGCNMLSHPALLQPNMTDACKVLASATWKCDLQFFRTAKVTEFTFFVVLSFCLTLMCLLLIVVVSLPRLKCTDLAYEAGRLWLFLLFIWLLFIMSVQLAFMAFWVYATTVYSMYQYSYRIIKDEYSFRQVILPKASFGVIPYIILGTTCLTSPALIAVCVYFSWLYPGHRAVHLACCSCTCLGPTQDFVDSYINRDVEEGKQGIFVSACPPAIIKVE